MATSSLSGVNKPSSQYAPRKSISSTPQQSGSSSGTSTPRITSERIIENEAGKQRITVYSDGSVKYENQNTGETSRGSATPGTSAANISIPEKGISSYQQTRPATVGQSTRQGYVLSTGEVTQDINKARADTTQIIKMQSTRTAPEYATQNGAVIQGRSQKEGYYILSTGKTTTSRQEAEADAPNMARGATVSYDIQVQEAARKTRQDIITRQPSPEGSVNYPDGSSAVYPSDRQTFDDYANRRLFQQSPNVSPRQRAESIQREYAREKPLQAALFGTPENFYAQRGQPLTRTGETNAAFGVGLTSIFAKKLFTSATGKATQKIAKKYGTDLLIASGLTAAAQGTKQLYLTTGELSRKEKAEIMRTASQAQLESVSAQPWYKKFAYQIPAIGSLAVSNSDYENSVIKQLEEKGVPQEKRASVARQIKNARFISAGGEGLGTLYVSKASETAGRAAAGVLFTRYAPKKEVTKLGTMWSIGIRTVPTSAALGYSEGFTTDIIQKASRDQKQNLEESNKAGMFGALSAGAFQFGSSGLSVAAPKLSKLSTFGGLASDPVEYPADVLASFEENFFKLRGKSYLEPTIIKKGKSYELTGEISQKPKTATEIFNPFGEGTATRPRVQTETKTESRQKQSAQEIFKSFYSSPKTTASQPAAKPATTFEDIIQRAEITGQTRTTTPRTTVKRPKVPDLTKVPDINKILEQDIPIEPKTTTTTATTTTSIGVSSMTPLFRIPPPFLFIPTSGATRKRPVKKRTYINELDAATSLFFGELTSTTRAIRKPKKEKKKEKVIKKKKYMRFYEVLKHGRKKS